MPSLFTKVTNHEIIISKKLPSFAVFQTFYKSRAAFRLVFHSGSLGVIKAD